jgi:hypothetical protein
MCGQFLVIKPTDYIARGFFLDTTPHKDKMKLFRVVTPLYRPSENFSFTHSRMIEGDHAALFHIDKKAYRDSAAIVFEKIEAQVEPLRLLRSPREFLSYISYMAGNAMLPVRLDFGLTHYLLGNVQQARDIFRRMDVDLNEYKPERQQHYRPVIRQVLTLLENDPAALRAVLDGWRDQKIERLGLAASVAPASLRLVE